MEIKSKEIKLIDIHALVENPKNNNRHPKEQIERLAKLIQYQGFRNPIIVSNRTGFMVAGHGRLEAAKSIGLKEVPVMYQDFENEAQEYAYVTSDNAIALWAELDLSAINQEMLDFGPDFDVDMLGLKDFVVEPAEKFEAQTDEDAVPENVDTRCKLGDVWTLGDHRLMSGDSTNIESIEKLMDGKKADLVFTDPPYNQETDGGFKSSIGAALKKQSKEIEHLCDFNPTDFLAILPDLFNKTMNALCFCNKDLVVDYLKWARDMGYAYNILIWKKPSAIPIGGSYRPDVEYLLVFRKSGIFNGSIDECNYSKVLEHKREKEKVHPTMKPVEMIENQLKIASNKDSVVVDLFGGSGSTLIACEKTKRKCFMMELDPHYCDVILKRWEQYTGKTAELTNGPT